MALSLGEKQLRGETELPGAKSGALGDGDFAGKETGRSEPDLHGIEEESKSVEASEQGETDDVGSPRKEVATQHVPADAHDMGLPVNKLHGPEPYEWRWIPYEEPPPYWDVDEIGEPPQEMEIKSFVAWPGQDTQLGGSPHYPRGGCVRRRRGWGRWGAWR